MFDLVLLLLIAVGQGVPAGTGEGPDGVRLLGVRTVPESVRTGDPFTLQLRLGVEAGWTLLPPDTLTYLEGARALGTVEVEGIPAGESGGAELRVAYPLQALRPGELALPPLRAWMAAEVEPGGSGPAEAGEIPVIPGRPRGSRVSISLGAIPVQSVLPAGTEYPEPAGPLPPPPLSGRRTAGLFLLGVLVSLGSGLGAVWLTRRRTVTGPQIGPSGSPPTRGGPELSVQEARRRLRMILAVRGDEPGATVALLDEAHALFRVIIQGEVPGGSRASTSTEILAELDALGAGDAALLRALMLEWDRHRFGRSDPPGGPAFGGLSGMKRWIEGSHA